MIEYIEIVYLFVFAYLEIMKKAAILKSLQYLRLIIERQKWLYNSNIYNAE